MGNALRNGALPDALAAALKELLPDSLPEVVGHLAGRFSRQRLLLALGDGDGPPGAANPFARGLVRACDLPAGAPPTPLWFGVYPGRASYLCGETGAGKSALAYNLAVHAARNVPLWDTPFGLGRPARVLYVDPENAGRYDAGAVEGGLCATRLDRLGAGRPADLLFHDGQGVNLNDGVHRAGLADLLRDERIDLLILDPLANLTPARDENDNAEGARHMAWLRELARDTGAAVLALHHAGKRWEDAGAAQQYGRGASARLAGADVGLLLRARGPREGDDEYEGETRPRSDVCRLQVTKDRLGVIGHASLYLRMSGDDRFERCTADDWRHAADAPPGPTKAELCADDLLALMQDGAERTRSQIIEAMRAEGYARPSVDDALIALRQRGDLAHRKGKRGSDLYRLDDPFRDDPAAET